MFQEGRHWCPIVEKASLKCPIECPSHFSPLLLQQLEPNSDDDDYHYYHYLFTVVMMSSAGASQCFSRKSQALDPDHLQVKLNDYSFCIKTILCLIANSHKVQLITQIIIAHNYG